ncbi:TPA: twin-arginine translocase TatA/TatE family subunit, partial [Candidatus Galligastranaerophilus intestinavium]|nr:twin-arginine translocase TatA/TatE family subunit [Candidatus Galligastranaerophilus intestinavium]
MSLGITEILLILVVIILLFGGKRIPEIARALGRASYEYKKAKNVIQKEAQEIKNAIEETG